MHNSVILIAYEINAQTAKTILQKRAGFSAKFKKFKVSSIVDHVANCWEQLEELLNQEDAKIEDRVLYTAKLSDPLRIGKVRNDILNNSFLMSVLVDDTQFGREARAGARYYQFKTNSDFEKKQFSLMLEEAKDRFEHQEVGIFGWVSISEEHVDDVLKAAASKFSSLNDGELHFIEFTQDGDIFPNFSTVGSQKFEGKLAGNYSLTLERGEYEAGIRRINEITKAVTRKSAVEAVSITTKNLIDQAPQEDTEVMPDEAPKKKNTYPDAFKKEVAEATQLPGATLASVGDQFGVSPTLVRNWKIKFLEQAETSIQSEQKKPKIESKSIQSWLQKSVVEGTIDSDGDLYVSLETSSEETTQQPTKLFITGTQKLASGRKNETSGISDQITTNEANWLRSDFLKGVGSDNMQFSYNLNCDVYGCSEKAIVPIKLKKGKASECPIKVDQLELSELNLIFEDGDFRVEGTIKGPNGFIYAAEVLAEEPEEGHVPTIYKIADDENSAEMYEWIWSVKKGDTVYVVLCAFEKLDGKLSCEFTGEAQVEEPASYDTDDVDTVDFEGPDVGDVETDEGDIGLFEFQIKRGLVDEEEIDDEDVQNLIDELKQLCEDENYEEAANLLLSNLSFEFGPDQLDDDPERFFANTDYIEFECTSENTSVKIGYDECLIVTISVQFEIPLNGGISTAELAEYLPDSGAWASASASPGWGYAGSDGDNVWFVGLKGYGGSNKDNASGQSEETSDGFEGAVYAITVQRSEEIIDFENISANNGSMRGPLINFFVAYDADKEGYHLVLEGEECFHASSEEYDWEAPKYALENIRNKLKMDLSISDNQVDQLIFYLTANITDEEEDIDNASFTHIVAEVCEINGEDHFTDVNEASNRIWVSTSQNLSYINIHLNIETNTLDFDEEALDEKEVVSWSDFVVETAKDISDLTVQPVGSTEFKIEVASACAESGINYKDFAEKYSLNADELNSWAVEYLGESFSSSQSDAKGDSIAFGVVLRNADSGHIHDLELIFDNTENFDASKLTANKTETQWKEVFYELFGNPKIDNSQREGLFYSEAASQLTRIAFDKLGWYDVTVEFNYIKIDNIDAELTRQDLDIISDYLGIQLIRDDYSMYFYG